MPRRFAAVILALSLTGCVNISAPPLIQVLGVEKVSDKNYTINRPADAVVGTDVIRVKDYSVTRVALNQVEVTSDFAFDHTMFSRQFKRGEIYPYGGTVEYDHKTYNIMNAEGHGILFDDSGTVFNKMLNGVGMVGPSPPVMMIYQFDPLPPGVHVRRLTGETQNKGQVGSNYQIIFTGITADTMRFSYREYTADDLARPAFSQELTYPIRSKEIRFRDLVIAINDVTSDHISYTVVADGTPPAPVPKLNPGI